MVGGTPVLCVKTSCFKKDAGELLQHVEVCLFNVGVCTWLSVKLFFVPLCVCLNIFLFLLKSV